MAEVFGCFKAPEVPLPKMDTADRKKEFKPDCVLVKETPMEPENEDLQYNSACDNEHVSHARDLLSYYQFHVRGIESLLNHHNDTERRVSESEKSRKALANRLEDTERRLSESEKTREGLAKSLDDTKDQLKKTQTSLEKSESSLTSTRKELKTNQDELCQTKKRLEAALGDLSKTADKLRSTELKLEQTNDICNGVKLELKSTKERLSNTESQLRKTQSDLSELNNDFKNLEESHESTIARNKALEGDLEKANEAKEDADEKADTHRKETAKAKAETNKIGQQLDELRRERTKAFLHHANRTRGDIYIDEVIYGGKNITDQTVLNRLLDFAESGQEFEITNDLMGGDPWRRETKSFTAVYAVGGKGPFKYISQREHQKVKFFR